MNYLVNIYKLIDNEQKVRELSYEDIVQYWNIYVNDPSNYDQKIGNDENIGKYDISSLSLNSFELNINDFDSLRRRVIEKISQELKSKIVDKGWLESDYNLTYNKNFKIEENETDFELKLNQLLENYSKPLNEAKFVTFNVIMIEDGFEHEIYTQPTGKTTIQVLNNKDADKIIDLSKEAGSKLEINTSKPYFSNSINLIKTIREEIIKSINKDFEYILKKSELTFEENFVPRLNEDYELIYFVEDSFGKRIYQTTLIDKAIEDVLLCDTENDVFYNKLSIEVKAKFNNESNFMKNSFYKDVVNNSSLGIAIKDTKPFDLSNIKSNCILINSEDNNFPVDEGESKAEIIYDLIIERVTNDINFWARKWIYANKIDLSYGIDYKIKFIKEFDEDGRPIYYDAQYKFEYLQVIQDVILNNLEENFNRDLYIEVYSNNSSNLSGSFIKKINNNYLNKAIENDNLGDIIIDEDNSDSSNNLDSIQNLLNEISKSKKIDMWWIITPITVIGLIIICAVVVFIVRKNRRIR